jgi:hypothetical protein
VVAPALYALRTAVASAREELVREATDTADDAQREPLVAAAGRLADSVLRPLDAALGSPARDAAVAEAPTLIDRRSHDDVRTNATAILERVKAGAMPCDGAWPREWVDVFERWTQSGIST